MTTPRRKKAPPGVRRPRQRRGVDTVRFILDAVDRILQKEGPAGVTTKRVAEVAGVGVGTVYQYFPDRVALLRETERRAWTTGFELLASKVPELLHENLERTIARIVRFMIDGVAHRVGTHGLTSDDADLRAARFQLFDHAEDLVLAALAPSVHRLRRPDVRFAARVAIETALMLGWMGTLRNKEALASRALQREVADMLVRYLVKDA